MLYQRCRSAERVVAAAIGAWFLVAAAPAAAQLPPVTPASPLPNGTATTELRTFELAKPEVTTAVQQPRGITAAALRPPRRHELLRTLIGVGYVQGADWGTELLAAGAIAGAQTQVNALITRGSEGIVLDAGSFSLAGPNSRWRIEGGDVFSRLRGSARGGRVSWTAWGNRRPAIAVYAPGRGTLGRGTVLSYRDGFELHGQTLIDAEIASDTSYLLHNRLAVAPVEVESFYRAEHRPRDTRDLSVAAAITTWRGVTVSAGLSQSLLAEERSEWRMVAVRVPISRAVDLTFERAFAGARESSQTTSAVMGNVSAGNLHVFHRYQSGAYELSRGGSSGTTERRQLRSMSSYSAGPRLNLTLQLATQHTDLGQVEQWEELQATMKLTGTTTLRTVTAIPDVGDSQRLQAFLHQQLPRGFAVQADYGRLSAYQPVARALDRPRFKLLLFKAIDIATPARGATVTGHVVDHGGRPIAGVRVLLGPYSADTDAGGSYRFAPVPRGEYELALDPALLPADYAWDGRRERLTVISDRRLTVDLKVAPLNAVHGRVYIDVNNNGRFDAGEAIANAVIGAGDLLTATDAHGAYSLYNLWPGTYRIELRSVPAQYLAKVTELTVTLLDGAPVTGADFQVVVKEKPIIWSGGK